MKAEQCETSASETAEIELMPATCINLTYRPSANEAVPPCVQKRTVVQPW